MEQLTNNSIIWAAGENSGDYLASRVLPAVAASRPNLKMEGIGGDRMIQDGLDPWFHASELSVRGYLEVIRHLPRILKIRREMMRRTVQLRPAAYMPAMPHREFYNILSVIKRLPEMRRQLKHLAEKVDSLKKE